MIFSDEVYGDVPRSAYLAFWTASLTSPVLMRINRAAYVRFHGAISGLFERAAEENGAGIDCHAAAISLIGLSDGLWLDLSIGVDDFTRADAVTACCSHIDHLLGRVRVPRRARVSRGTGRLK